MLMAASSNTPVLIAAIASLCGTVLVGILNYRSQARVVVTSRFTQAVDQLGDDKKDVRVGAIYALEQILRTSKAERRAIIELLVSFVRWHTRDRAAGGDGASEKTAPDVQAAMTVLGRRPRTRLGQALRIDPHETDAPRFTPAAVQQRAREPYAAAAMRLGYVKLPGADLRHADLRGSKLYNVNLRCAELRDANLRRADLAEANLQKADLHRADLREANLVKADLFDADLRGAQLDDAHLEDADLREADLRGADLRAAKSLHRAALGGAKANAGTKWPAEFDWQRAGVKRHEESVPQPVAA
jgi:Pentapeptide repeats (8 copies)